MTGPTFYLNFTDYGHADILDEWVRNPFASAVCKACDHVNKNCDFTTYRSNLADAVNYFMYAVDTKNEAYLNAIKNPTKSGMFNKMINIDSKYNENGFNILETGGFCKHL